MAEATRPHLSNRECRELEELLAEYRDTFAVDNEYDGRTNKVYHRIDTGDARPIRQPPRRLPVAKQA
jgi:stress response protein YsnF